MDEHKTGAVSKFLERELRAWEEIWRSERGKRGGRGKKWVLAVAAAAVVLTLTVAAIYLVPWQALRLPIEEQGRQEQTEEQTKHDATELESAPELTTQEQAELPLPPADLYDYDFSSVPAGATPIVPQNTAAKNHPVNQTDRVIDMHSVMAAACRIPAATGQISVLILHTHTGEGYNREGLLYLEESDEEFARSTDATDGVIAVGATIARRLNEAGIGTIHCKTVFDGESNRDAYARAAEAIAAFRLAYPGLVCVIDVHRASDIDADGNIVRSLAVQSGQGVAQTQVICGMGAEQSSKTNLALACLLYEQMNQAFPSSCASVICKEQALNQDLSPFCLTLEVGSCGNTPAEAQAAAEITARALCALFETR